MVVEPNVSRSRTCTSRRASSGPATSSVASPAWGLKVVQLASGTPQAGQTVSVPPAMVRDSKRMVRAPSTASRATKSTRGGSAIPRAASNVTSPAYPAEIGMGVAASHLVGVRHLPPCLGVDAASGLPHRFERSPRVGLRKQPRQEIAPTGLIDQVRVPPAQALRRASTLARPGHSELQGEDPIEGRIGAGATHGHGDVTPALR